MSGPSAVEIAVPQVVGELRLFDRVDYEDAYCVGAAVTRSPEQWLRAFIEDSPRWFHWPWAALGVAVFRARFGPLHDSPSHVLGWKVLVDRPEQVRREEPVTAHSRRPQGDRQHCPN